MLQFTQIETLFSHLQNGALVLTPTNRLSRTLLEAYAHKQKQEVSEKPTCLPYILSLHYLFKQLQNKRVQNDYPLILNAHQQFLLWHKILLSSETVIPSQGLIHEIQEAWKRCQHWLITDFGSQWCLTEQTAQFQQWRNQFEQVLNQLHAITEEQLATYVASHTEKLTPTTMIWVCFDDFTPQQIFLQKSLEEHGWQHLQFDYEPKTRPPQYYAAQDKLEETNQLIHWLDSRLDAGDERIAVVVPDLQTEHKTLKRTLFRHFPKACVNVSLGEALIQYPLVSHALHWLQLERPALTNHQVRLLLNSPFLKGSDEEFIARSEIMQEHPLLQEAIIDWSLFIDSLKKAPILAGLLEQLQAYPAEASIAQWISLFKHRLQQLKFPGEIVLHSETYQCLQRFILLFDEFLQLSVISPIVSQVEALELLRNLAQNAVFQAKEPSAKIQVLGLLEASGCAFDSVWVCGLTDHCLPQNTHFSAFIPIALQREQSMPHALPERELHLAQQLLQRFHHSTKQCIFSYPRLVGDIPHRASPLIKDFPPFIPTALKIEKSSYLEERVEQYIIPLAQDSQVKGGTALLANQAKCPFRAFAAHRLHAKTSPESSTGIEGRERGQLLHTIMEQIWQLLKNQQTLHTISNEILTTQCEKIIRQVLQTFSKEKMYSFPIFLQELEFERFKRLVEKSLAWDKQRPSFTIESLEQTYTLHLAGMDLKVRIDRMDKVGDSKWVIDYKSNLFGTLPWSEERPQEPQLLLYALLDEAIQTLVFLELKAGNITCEGFSADALELRGIRRIKSEETWSQHRQRWHDILSQLIVEFKEGHCVPKPIRKATCQQCDFQNLCRMKVI